jgi:hypothetical protein
VVSAVEVDAFEGGEVVSMSAEQLKVRLIERLEASRFVLLQAGQGAPKGAAPWIVRLAAGLTTPELDQEPSISVSVVLELRQKGVPEAWEVRGRRTAGSPGHDVEALQAAAREALDAAVAQAVREARALIELAGYKDDAVAQKLSDSDEAVVRAAVRVLARRHDRRALEPLVARLTATDDLTEIRETMGLLIELGDPHAATALIDASRAKDNVVQREIVFALGALGGDEAEAYLDAVATGHDDPLVRASAEQALTELRERRSKEGAKK